MQEDLTLPLPLGDACFISAVFPMPSSSARKLLPPNLSLNLIEPFPGQILFTIAFALYRSCPFGPYAEATLAVMMTHEPARPIITLKRLLEASRYPAYVLHMFVNTEPAQRLGVEVWKLPRQLADVQVIEQDRHVLCDVQIDDQRVVRCVCERPHMNRTRAMQIETYSQSAAGLLHTVMCCNAEAYGRTQGGTTLHWGDHPIGQRMARMGIKTQPLMIRYYDNMHAELASPQRIAGAG